jgi:hypothetical protein
MMYIGKYVLLDTFSAGFSETDNFVIAGIL